MVLFNRIVANCTEADTIVYLSSNSDFPTYQLCGLGEVTYCSMPQFPHLETQNNNSNNSEGCYIKFRPQTTLKIVPST